jgi:exosortase F-associated protein
VKKKLLITGALIILAVVYLQQRGSYAELINYLLPQALEISHANTVFVVNKTIRLVLNDLACLMLITALFPGKIYLKAALYLFLIELFVLLPLYFIIKLNVEGPTELSSPLLSQIHRLIVNPLLMFLLMIGFLYQRLRLGRQV